MILHYIMNYDMHITSSNSTVMSMGKLCLNMLLIGLIVHEKNNVWKVSVYMRGFPHSSVSKESACNAGDPDSIPGSGRSPGKEMATHSNILAWRIPWTEEPGRLQSMGLQEWDTT